VTDALYIAARDVDAGAGDGRPVMPGGWTVRRLATATVPAWAVIGAGHHAVVVRANELGARGLYALAGDRAWLDSLGSDAAPARELWRIANGPTVTSARTTARTWLRTWRWWRCDVTERPLLIVGSAEQYGRDVSHTMPLLETAVQAPRTIYAATKAAFVPESSVFVAAFVASILLVTPFHRSTASAVSPVAAPAVIAASTCAIV
jgi:hypothetical protein